MKNHPEREFWAKDVDIYEGMKLEEYTFTQMNDYNGNLLDYKLDIISPLEESETPRKVVFFVHGGGFVQPNDKRQRYIPMFAKHLTKAGYVVVSPDYPIYDNAEQRQASGEIHEGAKNAAEAVHRAYLYIKENAEKFNLDASRIAIMGGSAGGMTAFYLLENYDDKFELFVNCWGAPKRYFPNMEKFPPTISIHGTADQAVEFELEAPIQESLEKLGIDHVLIAIEGAPHTPVRNMDEYMPTILEWLEKYM